MGHDQEWVYQYYSTKVAKGLYNQVKGYSWTNTKRNTHISLTTYARNVLLLQQSLNSLLDIRNLRREALRELRNDLLDQDLILQRLSGLHDADNRRLNDVFTIFVDRPEHIHCLRFDLCLDWQVKIHADLFSG